MLLFPSISGRTMARALLPYLLGLLTAAAVMGAYLHFTAKTADTIEQCHIQRALRVAKSLESLLTEGGPASFLFTSEEREGFEYIALRDPYTGMLDLQEMQVLQFQEDDAGTVPFDGTGPLLEALAKMEPDEEWMEVDGEDVLLLVYPIEDPAGRPAVLRLVFRGIDSASALMEGRYSIYLAAAAAVLIVILPGVFIKLAEIRRQIEKTGFYRLDSEIRQEKSVEMVHTDVSPSSLMEGREFPALFRLDENGSILYMNRSAELLTDLTRDDVRGSLFHELPCFTEEGRTGIEYPLEGDPVEFGAAIVVSSGSVKDVSFRIEKLGRNGYAVSAFFGRVEEDSLREAQHERMHGERDRRELVAEGMTQESCNRVMALLNEGRNRFRNDEAFMEHMGRIHDTMVQGGARVSGEDDPATAIEVCSELESISSALNDVLPDRASVELDVPGLLPVVECTRQDFTQLVKNMVFYSLESKSGPVRIRIGARDVPSPVSDSVFSANCDRTVPRSVSMSYSDSTRIPAVLKEALMDPETDLSGIRRDYGSHIASVAAIMARLDCHPAFTEGSLGSILHVLLKVSEESLFDQTGGEEVHSVDLSSMRILVTDASRQVRESVCDALALFGVETVNASELEEARSILSNRGADHLVLDLSAVLDPVDEVLEELGRDFPGLRVIITGGLHDMETALPETMEQKVRMLEKPYTVDEILNIVELAAGLKTDSEGTAGSSGREA
ncbi:MAG: hypothetical protein AVO35_05250 [Candidatus Aegiribacteria sp. MLS_C]|nr:MAG: hypothetical protein AVO35_05250 [Candidatus Aegiribacteria sp. MLS_C]